MSRRNFGRQRPQRRLKGIAKAMSQAGVEWDERQAERIRGPESVGRAADRRRTKSSQPEQSKPAGPATDWMPLPALMAMLFAGLIGYFAAEASLAAYPHPAHWVATVSIGLVGYGGGLVWHRIRGY